MQIRQNFFIQRIINLLVAALYALCVRSGHADEVMIGQEDDELSAHSIAGKSVLLIAPELQTISLRLAWKGGRHAVGSQRRYGQIDIGGG